MTKLAWLWITWSRPVRYFMTRQGLQAGYVIRTDVDRVTLRRSRNQSIVHSVKTCSEITIDGICCLVRSGGGPRLDEQSPTSSRWAQNKVISGCHDK